MKPNGAWIRGLRNVARKPWRGALILGVATCVASCTAVEPTSHAPPDPQAADFESWQAPAPAGGDAAPVQDAPPAAKPEPTAESSPTGAQEAPLVPTSQEPLVPAAHEPLVTESRDLLLVGDADVAAQEGEASPEQEPPPAAKQEPEPVPHPPPTDAHQELLVPASEGPLLPEPQELLLTGPLDAAAEEDESYPIHGYLSSRYVGRWTGSGDSSQILYEVLSLEFGDPAKDKVTGFVMGQAIAELNGKQPPTSPLSSLIDTYSQSVIFQVYDAYVDVHHVGPIDDVRLGRQSFYDTPAYAQIDGVSLLSEEFSSWHARIGVYGGLPVELWDSSVDGTVLGSWIEAFPWTDGRVRLDWMHFDEDNLPGTADNDLLNLGVWQTVSDSVHVEGAFSVLDGDSRDVLVRGAYTDPDSSLSIQASYYQLLQTEENLVMELDPYTQILQEYFPYAQWGFSATNAFGENFDLLLGVDLRDVTHSADVGPYNRDYDREYVTGTLHGLLSQGLAFSLTADRWSGGDQEENTWGANVSNQFDNQLKGSIGTYWSLYKYNYFSVSERDDVRTWYLNMTYALSKSLSFTGGFQFEDAPQDEYYTLTVGALWRF